MKNAYILGQLVIGLFLSINTFAQTSLVAGDIAIVAYSSDEPSNEDEFSFILLKDITAGTTIHFTDFGWCSDINGFQSANPCGGSTGSLSDGALTWTAPAGGLTCGTQVYIVCGGLSLSASAGTVTGLQAVFNFPGEFMSLAVGGDQIFAFQGTLGAPTLITALGMNGAWDASLTQCAFTSTQSAFPAALSASTSLNIVPEVDNARYNCTVTNDSPANLRTAIFNSANWNTSDATPFAQPLPCSFSCSACTSPTIPSVTASPSSICTGGSSTLTITGSLNSATQWHVYTGFCGITPVGTTTGSTFVVSPTTTTSYYIRGEGGCVIPGTCGAVTVTVNPTQNAGFSYSASSYCVNAADPTPTITGVSGGTFSSTAGLSLSSGTGAIDVSASTPGTYTVTYTTPGPCPGSSNVTVTINALPNAGFNYSASSFCVNAADPSPTVTGAPGGNYTSSPAGLSINASTGVIDVSASTPGTYTVTRTLTSPCTNSANVSVTINPLDNASFSYSASAYCVNALDPTPTITGLTGGTFSSTAGLSINASSGTIDVSASTPGTYTVTYTTSGTCPNTSNVSVTINALDNASFNYSAASYCTSGADPTPTITGLTGGSFSSTAGLSINASTGTIDVSASTPGTYTVTYTTTGACPNASNVTVTINAGDNASFLYSASSYCVNATDPTPTITGLPGGSFSSTAGLSINASTGTIDVSASTPGTYTVTYTTSGACPNSSNVSVTISPLDNASFFYSGFAHCLNGADPTPTISGLPGGMFSSTAGLSINASTGTVDVSASTPGTYLITYTTSGPCTNSSSVSMAINAPDNASFSYSAASYCTGDVDPTPTVTGFPVGFFTAGAGLTINASTGTIDLSASTPGTYTVTYNTSGPCPNSSSVTVTINTGAAVTFTALNDLCIGSGLQTGLGSGTPTGGIYSGPGVTDNGNGTTYSFDPVAAGLGIHTITYSVSAGCASSASDNVEVTANDNASFSYSAPMYCTNGSDPTPTITGVAGGTFSSTAGLVIDGSTGAIDLSASTVGTYTVTYTTTGPCSNSSTQTVMIAPVPVAPSVISPLTFCPGDDVILTATGSGTGNIVFYDGTMTQLASIPTPPATVMFNVGSLVNGTYTYFATEFSGGCESTPTQIDVLVGDVTNPVAICQNITVFLDATGNATITANDIDGGSTDNCGPVTLSASQTSFDCSNIGGSPAGTLIITGAYDGPLTGGTPKGVELYVANDIADLSQYGLGSANNGGGTDGQEFTFPAVSVTAGTYIYVASEAPQFTNFFGFAPDYTDGSMGINGDDAVELFHMGSVIDVFGNINLSGTGQPWEYLDGWAYRNSGTGPDGTTFTLGSWSFSGINMYDGQTTNATTPTPLPIGTFTPASSGSTQVTLTVTDGSGNTASCTANVTVQDTISPTVTCPGNQTETPDASCNFTLPDYSGLVTSSDNCGTVTVTQSPLAGTVIAGTTTITMTATDANGNTSSCSFDVILNDATPPLAVCQNATVYLDGSGLANIAPSDIDGGSSDNCAGLSLSVSTNSFTCAAVGANNVTLTVTDGNSNTSTCTAVVTILDTISPVAICQNINAYLNGSGMAIVFSGDVDGGSVDNCSIAGLSSSPAVFNCANIGTNMVSLQVTDPSGNTGTCTSIVTVIDTVSPIAVCQNITAYLDGTGNATIVAADIDGGSTDNCGTTTLAASPTSFNCSNTGANNVTLTVTDASGNSATCTAVVTVLDTISPTAVCQNITTYLDGAGNASIVAADIDGGSTDNCSAVTLGASTTAFTCVDLGANNVTLTVTDASGNASTCTAIVTIADTIDPTIVCPGNQLETPNASCQFTLPDYTGLVTASDNCGSTLVTQFPLPGTVIGGTTTLTLTADDGNGNTSTCTFDVILNDATPPTAVCQDIIVYLDGSGNASIVASDIDGGSTDNCGTLSFSASQTTFTCANIGANSITLTVTDGNANTAMCTATVTVADTTSPVIVCPGDQTETASPTCDFTLPDYTGLVTSSDNCSASPAITQSPIPGTVITSDQVITMTSTDGSGNTSTCTFNVLLIGATPPTAVCQNITVFLDGAGNASITASDIDGGSTASCGGLTLSASQTAFTCADLGTVNVTLTATDGGGNTANCTAVVTVVDTISPTPNAASLADVTADCQVTSLVAPTATDNCGSVTVTNDATLPISTQGTTVVTWTYDDGNGNTTTQTQNVVINDVSSPLPTAAPLPDVVGQCSVDVMPSAPIAIDACAGVITGVEMTGTTFPITTQGTTVLLWQFDDGNGNISTQTQNIIVNDVTAPTPDVAQLADINGDCSIDTPVAPTATDNCEGTIIGTTSTVFPITAIGTTTIVWEFVDGNGNVSTQTQDAVNTGIDASVTIESDDVTITANTAGATYAWLNCDFNTVISGQTSQSFTPAANGNYAAIVTVGNCTDTSACQAITSVGISALAIDQLSVFPNPSATGFFTVNYEGNIQAIDVVDLLGRVIELPTDLTSGLVDGSELSYGRYVIRVTTETSVLTTEIVIAK